MRKRLLIVAVVLFLLAGTAAILWSGLDWPPPRLILKYGFPPTGGPTGKKLVIEGIEFVELKPGYFRMGSHYLCEKGDLFGRINSWFGLSWGTPPTHDAHECPPRWVEIEKPFWIATTELTNAQFVRFFPAHRGHSLARGDQDPVTQVPWYRAKAYCMWLSERSGTDVCLPESSQWEYACRAGSARAFCVGDDEKQLGEYAWFDEEGEGGPKRVAGKSPNQWGLYDMHGNVDELILPADMARGGHWMSSAGACRSAAYRTVVKKTDHYGNFPPRGWSPFTGLRLVLTPPEDE